MARACADLGEQQRELEAGAGGKWFLELAPVRAKVLWRAMQPWIFGADGRVIAAGFMVRGRLQRALHVVLAERSPETPHFWEGLAAFGRAQRVGTLRVFSFGEQACPIPAFARETHREKTVTYMLDLTDYALPGALSKGHRWCLGKARKAGLKLVAQPIEQAVRDHMLLCDASFDRRRARGEEIPSDALGDGIPGLVRSGHAALMQAGVEDRILASHLIVRVEGAAYYLSSGASPEGMEKGASQFLMCEAIGELQREGFRSFNLGFSAREGIIRFKAGFGAWPVPVEWADFELRSPARRLLGQVLRSIRR
jgi:hypothetical protein